MTFKYFNVELEGIDKCGKDSIRPYIFLLEPGKYMCRARGLMSQIAYSSLYNRNFEFDAKEYVKNTLFVLLDVDEQDWKFRCKLTNEPNPNFDFSKMRNAFIDSINELKKIGVKDEQILQFNTSVDTPYTIAKRVCEHLEYLNGR